MPKINRSQEEHMPLHNATSRSLSTSSELDLDTASVASGWSFVSARSAIAQQAVERAQTTAAEFVLEMGPVAPWTGGGRGAGDNWQSLIGLAGLMRRQLEANADQPADGAVATRNPPPRDAVWSDFVKEFGTRGLQICLDIGLGFGAHQIVNEVLATHNIVGGAHGAAPANATAATSSNSTASTDVGTLFSNSRGLGFVAPAFVSGSAAAVAGHMVGALLNTPRTTGSPGGSALKRFGHEQMQNFLFNLPGMVGGFTAANLVLSGLDVAGRNSAGVEWLLWSLGGGLGGALGGTMNMAYKVYGMGQKVQDVDRNWDEKLKDLKHLDFKTWIKFIPAHLLSLTPIQYQGTASSALLPGVSFADTLARRSANTLVLQAGFWGLHGNVQKFAEKALGYAEKMGRFCHDRGHLCSPRRPAADTALEMTVFLDAQRTELLEIRTDLSSLLEVLRNDPARLGDSAETVRSVEGSLACMAALQAAPPLTNEEGNPTTSDDVTRWYAVQQHQLKESLQRLARAGTFSDAQSSTC